MSASTRTKEQETITQERERNSNNRARGESSRWKGYALIGGVGFTGTHGGGEEATRAAMGRRERELGFLGEEGFAERNREGEKGPKGEGEGKQTLREGPREARALN